MDEHAAIARLQTAAETPVEPDDGFRTELLSTLLECPPELLTTQSNKEDIQEELPTAVLDFSGGDRMNDRPQRGRLAAAAAIALVVIGIGAYFAARSNDDATVIADQPPKTTNDDDPETGSNEITTERVVLAQSFLEAMYTGDRDLMQSMGADDGSAEQLYEVYPVLKETMGAVVVDIDCDEIAAGGLSCDIRGTDDFHDALGLEFLETVELRFDDSDRVRSIRILIDTSETIDPYLAWLTENRPEVVSVACAGSFPYQYREGATPALCGEALVQNVDDYVASR